MAGARPELLSLLLSTDDIEVFLDNLARTASESLGASCAVTVRSGRMPLTAAHSDSLAAAVDEAQYEQGQGPCLHALDSGDIVAIPDVTRDDRWAGYHAHALAHGVRSSLSLPLQADGLTTGALNLLREHPRLRRPHLDVRSDSSGRARRRCRRRRRAAGTAGGAHDSAARSSRHSSCHRPRHRHPHGPTAVYRRRGNRPTTQRITKPQPQSPRPRHRPRHRCWRSTARAGLVRRPEVDRPPRTPWGRGRMMTSPLFAA
jgi:hypothetical protein